ncbi:MAG: alginate lyase family protein [Chitinophagales bacterium]|nr:alginate lyase family protein [Chitinophagales bacterium]
MRKYTWYLNRWLAMEHPGEDFFRIRQFYQHRVTDKKHAANPPHIPTLKARKFLKQYSRSSLKSILPAADQLEIYHYFNQSIPNVLEIDNWSIDRKNNIDSSQKRFVHEYKYKEFESVGEIKYVFEPARLHYFPVIASYAYAFDDQEILDALTDKIQLFIEENPFLRSINWSNGIEVGIRSINLLYTRIFVSLFDPSNPVLKPLDDYLYLSAHYLVNHLSMYSSANNHLLAELCGLIAICSFYEFPESDNWYHLSMDGLIQELNHQFHEDGFHKEGCTHYHSEVVSYYICCLSFSELRAEPWHEEALKRIKLMLNISQEFWNTGRTFHIGDSDEGHLLYPYFDKTFSDEASLTRDAVVLFGTPRYTDNFDWKNYIIHGEQGYQKFNASPKQQIELKTAHYKSGLSFIREDEFEMLFDASPLGLRPLAAHAHSDALQILLNYRGVPFLIDPGTYQYHWKFQEVRDYFISVHAHNTISIDGLNQASIVQNFNWKDLPELIIKEQLIEKDEIRVTAEHNGFILQTVPIMHRRIVRYHRQDQTFEIIDLLFGEKEHTCSYYLHFNPDLDIIELNGDTLELGKGAVIIKLKSEIFNNAEIKKGAQGPMLGWYSDSYDRLQETSTLVAEKKFENKLEIRMLITAKE